MRGIDERKVREPVSLVEDDAFAGQKYLSARPVAQHLVVAIRYRRHMTPRVVRRNKTRISLRSIHPSYDLVDPLTKTSSVATADAGLSGINPTPPRSRPCKPTHGRREIYHERSRPPR
jgi:hypothetical protein